MRLVEVKRETKETRIAIRLNPDGTGKITVDSGVPFFDHMLNAMARHGGFDLTCTAKGDLGVDCHHTIEDIGIVLGDAVKKVMGDGKGIKRFSHAIIPTAGAGDILSLPAHLAAGPLTIFPQIFSSISSIACAPGQVSQRISHSPVKTIITSARQCSRHSVLRLVRRCPS
jgi:hypothetical protein